MSEQPTTVATPGEAVEYREIPGHPAYRVGDDGSVWSRWKRVGLGRGSAAVLGDKWKRLRPTVDWKGRLRVSLRANNRKQDARVSRLVMLAFKGPCPPGMEVAHENGNPADNRLANLAYKTHVDNMDDQLRHGTRMRGERSAQAKLTEEIVRSVREEYAAGGVTQQQIADRLGVNNATISMIITRRLWAHV